MSISDERLAEHDLLQRLRKRYTGDEVPPCPVCGAALTIQSAGGGNATVYGCEGHRPFDREHYERSRWTHFRPGDPDVLALIELQSLRAAAPSGDEVEAMISAFWANITEVHVTGTIEGLDRGLIAACRAAAKVRAGREGENPLGKKMRASGRFPYTYAADWVRMAGLAIDRAEASQWRRKVAESMGVNDEDFAKELALEYIADAVQDERNAAARAAKFQRLAALSTQEGK